MIILYIFLSFIGLIYLTTFLLIRHMNKMGFGNKDDGLYCLLVWVFSPVMMFFLFFDNDVSEYRKGFLGLETITDFIFGIRKK